MQLAELEIEQQNSAALLEIEQRNLALAEKEYQRLHKLVKKGSVSRSDADSAERTMLNSRTSVQNLMNTLALYPTNRKLLQVKVEQAQRDLRDIELLNRRLTGEAWRSYVTDRTKSPLGYQASPTGVQPIISDDDTLRLRRKDGGVSLPLKVRGTTIGALDVTPRKGDEPPDEETRSMLEAVAERVALALDSTRLGEMAEQRAKRDQILSTLSAEFQASSDLPGILRAAASGVSQAFGSSRGFAQLTLRADEPVTTDHNTDPMPD